MLTDDTQADYNDDDYVHEYQMRMRREELRDRLRMRREELRDRFAIAALPAIIEKYGKLPVSAKWAYEVADDMLAAREQKGVEA
jgi:hypothetical protein